MAVYVGDLLTASAAPVSGKPTPTRTWQWLRGSTAISGATSSTYTVTEDDLGATLSVRQTETNIGGSDTATSLTVGPIATFTPSVLFASSEPGVWYDPSDLTTLFQDTAGTTPVTTPGQTVGLMLDKSKGLTLGPELVTNGGFAGEVSTPGSTQPIGTESNKAYRVTYDIISFSRTAGGTCRLTLGTTGLGLPRTSVGSFSEIIYPAGAATNQIYMFASADVTVTFDNISVRELPGFHATQPTAAARPTYQVDAGGRGYLAFDGVDDFMVTPTITPGTDKVQVFAGVRKLSDAAAGIMVSTSASPYSTTGAFLISAPDSASANYGFRTTAGGTTNSGYTLASASPNTSVLTCSFDASGSSRDTAVFPRQNGTVPALTNVGAALTPGVFAAHPIYLGRLGGASNPFNGHIYSLITRFGPNLDTSVIESTEGYVAGKTGVEL